MGTEKRQFIDSYICKLEDILTSFQCGNANENVVFDVIQEVKGIFIKEIPEIDEAIWMRSGSAERDANIVIGILRLKIIDLGAQNSVAEQTDLISESLALLKLEFDGIKGTISDYTSQSNILNYLSKLEEAINIADIKTIKYCLLHIEEWYKVNISKIRSNEFCFNQREHDDNKKKVEKFYEMFKDVPDSANLGASSGRNNMEPIIFLSHKSDDKKYGDALEKFITGLGVKSNQLIYTSHPLHKIPLDENIYDYLKRHIYGNMFMIILWSDKYLDSPACLNEMGAAWVTQSDYTNIYVPSFSFGNPKYHECAVDTRKMGAVLNGDAHCKSNMIELKNKIQSLFGLTDDEQKSSYLLDQFIKDITEENING